MAYKYSASFFVYAFVGCYTLIWVTYGLHEFIEWMHTMTRVNEKEKVNFTASRIDEFFCPKDDLQAFLWDSGAPGLGLRATPTGAKAYIFQAKIKRQTVRTTIGSLKTWNISTARAEARRLKMLTDQGIDPRKVKADQIAADETAMAAKATEEQQTKQQEMRDRITVAEVWAEYLAQHEKRWGERHMLDHVNLSQAGGVDKKRGKGKTVKGVLYPLLQKRMVDINGQVLTDWQLEEAKTRANNARQGFEMFRAFWRWCASKNDYKALIDLRAVEDNDLRAEVPNRKSKKFDVLQRAQMQAWFDAVRKISNPIISAYLQTLMLTGARREEMAALRWDEVNFQWNYIWVKDKVDEQGRQIPLTPYLSKLIAGLPKCNEYVFSSPRAASGKITEPRKAHNNALKVAKLHHVSLHGLRRTFGSLAEWLEIPSGVIAQIMGHAPSATAEKHYIYRPLELLAVWHNKYEAWILEQAGIASKTDQAPLRSIQHNAIRNVLANGAGLSVEQKKLVADLLRLIIVPSSFPDVQIEALDDLCLALT